jgi:hypothetical protein
MVEIKLRLWWKGFKKINIEKYPEKKNQFNGFKKIKGFLTPL